MDNPTPPDLSESVASIDASLKDILNTEIAIVDAITLIDDEMSLYRRTRFPVRTPRDAASWPWAPGTVAQGFLGARWNRRDGNVYGTTGLRGAAAANSPIRGGDDAQAQVDVPSGARRS